MRYLRERKVFSGSDCVSKEDKSLLTKNMNSQENENKSAQKVYITQSRMNMSDKNFSVSSERLRGLRKKKYCSEKNCHNRERVKYVDILRDFFTRSQIPTEKKGSLILFEAVEAARCSLNRDDMEKKNKNAASGDKDRNKSFERKGKTYLTQGLYAFSFNYTRESDSNNLKKKEIFPLPIHYGITLIDHLRDFKLPWNLFATSKKSYRPGGWRYIKQNIYGKEKFKKIFRPKCNCKQGSDCGDGCLNRELFYECDDATCALDNSQECSNRAFQDYTKKRMEGRLSSLNTEIIWTGKCGFGLRSLRDFEANSLIVEYCGEVIEKNELFRRMNSIYKDARNYYFLNFESGLVLDAGIKGNEARFINHSCKPNCKIEKWYVKGIPRIGVFVGEAGLFAGEDITYDYNFRKAKAHCIII
ncbi:hypothetical protein PNEG_00686 [Pneumocystis murina B123]|uniref:SET domain-containing protein n=1 Tax=Pneumocystis murina (strain B123) TaxID=1069680 RepID=M7NUV5_PNEMU|nr:hypothetical protein PNEG_00686 [Pneumocystis murina B123]EMR11087.1 hypothetical protein PNEG_00686 [Pneumocystis murina B123]